MIEKLLAQHTIEKARRPVARFPDRVRIDIDGIIQRCSSGEEALIASVLALAVHDSKKREFRADAISWLLATEDGPGTLRWYCQLINIEPVAIWEAAGLIRRGSDD